jgi:hypothetical protein
MRYLRSFGRFWWNFIVGDDWRVAAGVAVALGLTEVLTQAGVNAWWLLRPPLRSSSAYRCDAPPATRRGGARLDLRRRRHA